MSSEQEQEQALVEWREQVDKRAACRAHAISRGRQPRRHQQVAADAWRCEERWQAEDQLDIWQCIDNAVLDERRKQGFDEDDDRA